VKSSGAARALADAAIVRLAMSRQFTDISTLLAKASGESPSSATAPSAKKNESSGRVMQPAAKSSGSTPPPSMAAPREAIPPKGKDWDRALRDPLVQKVREAVDGTLLDVRPVVRPETVATPAPTNSEASEAVEQGQNQDLFSTE
jgi:hypothetical protein